MIGSRGNSVRRVSEGEPVNWIGRSIGSSQNSFWKRSFFLVLCSFGVGLNPPANQNASCLGSKST